MISAYPLEIKGQVFRRSWVCALLIGVTLAAGAHSRAAAQESAAPSAAADADGVEPTSARPLTVVAMRVEGRARTRATPEQEWIALRENDVLRPGAEVQTGLRSLVALRIGSNSTVVLDAASTLLIPQVEQLGGQLISRSALKSGRMDIKVDKVGLDNDFTVTTPSAVIAVRSTTLAVQSGRLHGTEVTGARTNLISAIEALWMQRRLAYYFGHGSSSQRFPNPAIHGLDRTVRRHLIPGMIDDESQLEEAWINGGLQNVVFNIRDIQQLLNLDSEQFNDELSTLVVLQQLLEIRAKTGELANDAEAASLLAQSFAQKAVQLAAMAASMLPDIESTVEAQSKIASIAAGDAAKAKVEAIAAADEAHDSRNEALLQLANTIIAINDEDFRGAQMYADAASLAALLATKAALAASDSAGVALGAAMTAASAASVAQGAINQYFSKVAEIDGLANDASIQASIAASAAQTAKSLDSLAQQLGALIPDSGAASIVAQIDSNTMMAMQSSISAAQARDDALSAASNARSLGEMTLFNWAAVYASQAAADAAAAADASAFAAKMAAEAVIAAELAKDLAGNGKGGD